MNTQTIRIMRIITKGETMLQKIRNTKGFTLIELMIVGAIIGIFLAILVPTFISFMDDEESANSDIQIEQTIDEKEDEKSEGKL